ncbi:MAG: hypothetical protein V9F82_04940 [Dermatophilaceae bacterium]
MTTYPTVLDAPDVAELVERVARADYERARRRRQPGGSILPGWDDRAPQERAAALTEVEPQVLAALEALVDMGFAVVPEAWTGLSLSYVHPPAQSDWRSDGRDPGAEPLKLDTVTTAAEAVVKGAGQAAVSVAMASIDQVRSVGRKVTKRIHAA